MSQHTRFLDAIIDEPEEDGHRLVYADYLEEQGDPRGEFVRLQCERKHLTPLTKEHDACVQRESELLARHEGQWDSELATSFGKKLTYDRGFVNHVEMRATQFLKVGQDLLRRTPLETIRLTFLKGQVQKLEGEGLLERLRGIDLRSVRYPAEEFERLIQALPLLTRLHAKQSCHPVNEHYAKVLLDGPAGKNLQHLEFTSIETGFYRFLGSRGGLPNLKSFRLGNAVMGGPRPKYFKDMDWRSLEHLQVDGTIRVADMQELAHMAPLKHIEFRYGSIPERGLRAMLEAGCFAQAEKIVFYGSQISEKALTALFRSDLNRCRYLNVRTTDFLSDGLCKTIAEAERLGSLEMFVGLFSSKQQQQYLKEIPCKSMNSAYENFVDPF